MARGGVQIGQLFVKDSLTSATTATTTTTTATPTTTTTTTTNNDNKGYMESRQLWEDRYKMCCLR